MAKEIKYGAEARAALRQQAAGRNNGTGRTAEIKK